MKGSSRAEVEKLEVETSTFVDLLALRCLACVGEFHYNDGPVHSDTLVCWASQALQWVENLMRAFVSKA